MEEEEVVPVGSYEQRGIVLIVWLVVWLILVIR